MKPTTITANEAYDIYHVTRAWLRERRTSGAIRCAETHGKSRDGRPYVKYLYHVEDIERELRMFSPRKCGWQGARQREEIPW